EDARVLRTLPPVRPAADLSEVVLRGIAERRLSPVRPPAVRPAAYPEWAGLAAAAAVLLGLGVASYFYFARAFQRDSDAPLAGNRPGTTRPAPAVEQNDDSAVARHQEEDKEPPKDVGPQGPPRPAPASSAVAKVQDKGGETKPGPKPPEAPKP